MTRELAKRGRSTGVTLVELLVTLAVIAIVVSVALPTYRDTVERSRLKATVERVRSDLHLARTEALKRNRTINVSFTRNGDGSWCYGMRATVACDCTQAAPGNATFCFLDLDPATNARLPARVTSDEYPNITMDAVGFGGNLAFRPTRPTLVAGNVSFSSTTWTARIVAADIGRLRICSPNPARALLAYEAC